MNIDKIDNDLIISKKWKDCYLLYTTKEYYLFKPVNNAYESIKIDINEKPTDVENSLINSSDDNKISDNSGINKSLRFLSLHFQLIGIETVKERLETISEFFYDLTEIEYYIEESDGCDDEINDFSRIKRFKEINDETIITQINEISKEITRNKKDDEIGELYNSFKIRKGVEKAKRDLGNYLNKECGVILRENTHDLYKLDYSINGYNSTTIDKIIAELTEIFGENNLFSTNDVETAVDFISERLTPEYNIVKFSNGLYSMDKHELVNPDNPVFTLIESPYDYNPDAKPTYIKDFLYSSLEKNDDNETERYVKGVLEYIGYLFTSGNSRNILGWITGIGGGGKSTFANIIQAIFGNKCADLDFAEIENNTHSTSILVGNHLNIVREAETGIVTNNKPYKTLAGNEPIPINPKHQHPYMLPKNEVPKSVMVANNIPPFKNPVLSIIQRFLIIEFNHLFRNTDNMIEDLDEMIIENANDMEWLIYNSLEAYKEMVESGNGFYLKLSDEKTKELMYKHSKPLQYLVSKLILKHDKEAYESEVELSADAVNGETEFSKPYIVVSEFNDLIIYLSKKHGVEIPLDAKTGKVNGRTLLGAIKDEFDLSDYQLEKANGGTINYTSITKKVNGKVFRIYPELIKTPEYDELFKEMKNAEYAKEVDETMKKLGN